MNSTQMPQTPVRDVMVSLKDAIHLESRDGVQEAVRSGLYSADDDRLVAIHEGAEVLALTTASTLRAQILPRTWQAPLKAWVTSLPAPPEVCPDTLVAELAFFIQDQPELEWALVVEGASGAPVGALDRATIVRFLPPFETTVEVFRAGHARLWGDSPVRHYYYCPVEQRTYGPHAVRPDPQGRMRDRKGHLVEVRALPQDAQGGRGC